MANVTVTLSVAGNVTAHADFLGHAPSSLAASPASAADPVFGFANSSQPTLTVTLDGSSLYDVQVRFSNAAPIEFHGFNPGSGGDLLALLAAQGYTP